MRQPIPATEQVAEGVLYDVLRCLPVAEDHIGQPDQPDSGRLVQRADRDCGLLGPHPRPAMIPPRREESRQAECRDVVEPITLHASKDSSAGAMLLSRMRILG